MILRQLLILVLALTIPVGNDSFTQKSPTKNKAAKKLFSQKCAKCHGSDGTGTSYGQIVGATDLSDPVWQERVDDQRIINSITHGRGQMPSFEKKLSKEQIELLYKYVRALRE